MAELKPTIPNVFTPGKRRQVNGITHGMSHTRTYKRWRLMMQRCYNPSLDNYKRYGGRGIRVCERWHLFENFFADMGECPDGMTLDRKDGSRDYGPGNCRWATPKQQQRNMSRNRRITFKGRTLCIVEWSEIVGISAKIICTRLDDGWSVDDALTVPAKEHAVNQRLTAIGESLTVSEWARRTGLSVTAIRARLKAGWTPDDAVGRPHRERLISAFGQSMTVKEWAAKTGIGIATINWRLRNGQSPEDALTTIL